MNASTRARRGRGRQSENKRRTESANPIFSAPSFSRKRESTDRQRHPRESGDKPATRNQAQIATSGSPLPLRERARVRVTRASAAVRAGRPRSQGARTCQSLYGRRQARGRCGRDALAPRGATLTTIEPFYERGLARGWRSQAQLRRRRNFGANLSKPIIKGEWICFAARE